MPSKNDNPLDQIGGFFDAFFGACMGEERKAVKKKDESRNPSQTKPDNQGNIFGNLVSAFNHDGEEISGIGQDARQMRDMFRYKEGGIGSNISTVTKYFSGQEPPGFFTDLLDVITGETPPYARPLSQDQRDETVKSLRQFSEESSSYDSYGLSQSANNIANNLEERDNFGYRHPSLASAADAAGLTREKIQVLFEHLNKSIASKQAKDLASDLRQNPQNKQLFSSGFPGSSPADNLYPQPNQRGPFSHNGFGAGAAVFRGTHTSRLLAKKRSTSGSNRGPNSSERR